MAGLAATTTRKVSGSRFLQPEPGRTEEQVAETDADAAGEHEGGDASQFFAPAWRLPVLISRWVGGALTRFARRKRRRRLAKRSKFIMPPVDPPAPPPPPKAAEPPAGKTRAEVKHTGALITTPHLKPKFNRPRGPRI